MQPTTDNIQHTAYSIRQTTYTIPQVIGRMEVITEVDEDEAMYK